MLDLTLLRNFIAVARTGSISIAASQVGRTQSALSMQIRRLEEQIGTTLLHRSSAGIRLTAGGEKLLPHAEALLTRHDEILREMNGDGLSGAITLGCPEDYSIAFLPQLLRGFGEQYPQIEIRLICAPTTELRPQLHRRQIDMAIVSLANATDRASIRKESFAWVASEPHPPSLGQDTLPLALSAPMTIDHRAACDAMEGMGRRYRIAYASNSFAGLVAIARSGQAISVITRTAVPTDLFDITGQLPSLPSIGIAVEFSERRPSAAAEALGAHIRATLPGL